MRSNWIGWVVASVAGMGLLGVIVFRDVSAQPAVPAAAPAATKYTVVETDGTNLLVVDNSTNLLHFYTVDQGKEVGDDLHLRGSLDLNEVGKPTLKAKKIEKKEVK